MKKILKDMGVSLLTGVSFTVGVMLVLIAAEFYEEQTAVETVWVDKPLGIEVVDHELKEDAPRFTVVGEIRNSSSYDWKALYVRIEIYAGAALVNSCEQRIYHFPAESTKPFEFQCFDVAGINLPDNVSYKIRVRSGNR